MWQRQFGQSSPENLRQSDETIQLQTSATCAENLNGLTQTRGPQLGNDGGNIQPQLQEQFGCLETFALNNTGVGSTYEADINMVWGRNMPTSARNTFPLGNGLGNDAPFSFESPQQIYYTSDEDDIDDIAQGTKRKLSGEDSNLVYNPTAKQHITDEKIAAGMNNLSIVNYDHNYSCNTSNPGSLFHPDNVLNMTFSSGDVPEDVELESYEDICETEETNAKEQTTVTRRGHPVFQFNAPLENFIKQKIDILPSGIIEQICKPCLAVVPWTPPLNDKTEEKVREDLKNFTRNAILDEMEQ